MKSLILKNFEVRGILDGSITQIVRVVKQEITPIADESNWYQFDHGGINYRMNAKNTTVGRFAQLVQFSPFGQPGQLLAGKEAFACAFDSQGESRIYYRATDADNQDIERWFPSSQMPQAYSRLTLKNKAMRVERVQDCSEADAVRRGAKPRWISSGGTRTGMQDWWSFGVDEKGNDIGGGSSAKQGYELLWDCINGPDAWDANPWVWVLDIERVKP